MSASSDPVATPFPEASAGNPIKKLGFIAAYGSKDELKTLLENLDLPSINACGHQNETALANAAAFGKVENVKLLLSKGADVDTVCNGTALGNAAFTGSYGSDEVVRLLLEKKPDMTLKNKQGKTALDIVRERSAQLQNAMFESKLKMIQDNTPGAKGGKRRRMRLNTTRRKRTQKKKGSRSK
jgi:hypothetical protein